MSLPIPLPPALPDPGHPVPRRLAHPGLTGPPDAAAILKGLRRRWALGLTLGLLLAATVGSAVWLLLPREKYKASTTLHVSLKPRRVMFEPRDSQSTPETYQRTVVALLRDGYILS